MNFKTRLKTLHTGAMVGFRPERCGKLARIALYLFVVLVACPVRYWPLKSGVDETWRFALNYAPFQGLLAGRNVIFTMGPLAYLIFPQNVGSNLAHGRLVAKSNCCGRLSTSPVISLVEEV